MIVKMTKRLTLLYLGLLIVMMMFRSDAFSLHSNRNNIISSRKLMISRYNSLHNSKIKVSNSQLQVSSVSLDVSVLPVPQHHYRLTILVGAMILAFLVLLKSYSDVPIPMTGDGKMGDWLFDELIPNLRLQFRIIAAKAGLFTEKAKYALKSILNKPEAINLNKWNVCVIQEREVLKSNFYRYRLALPHPYSIVPLSVGQELLLCAVDNRDQVVKEAFYPVSSLKAQGYFDIIVKCEPDSLNENSLSKLLNSMSLGDELAFKGGEYRLRYGNSIGDEIEGITIVGSGSGIAPSLQILRGILSMDDIAVKHVEFIWINEDRKDFVLEKEVETLELQHYKKFTSTKVLEKGLFGRDIGKNAMIDEDAPSYKHGRVAIVCAPDYHSAPVTQFLVTQKKYPIQAIAIIDTQL